MEPFLAVFAEFWWIGPTAIGAGALGWLGLRGQRGRRMSAKARRLAYDASRLPPEGMVSSLDSLARECVGRLYGREI